MGDHFTSLLAHHWHSRCQASGRHLEAASKTEAGCISNQAPTTDLDKQPMMKQHAVAEVRELLRHASHPARLEGNAIFAHLRNAGAVDGAGTMLCRYVRGAFAALEPTHRSILTRCDLDGERHAEVASDLGLSRRQFYRCRAAAMEAAAATLSAPLSSTIAVRSDGTDALELALALSRAREQAGAWRSAARELESLAGAVDTASERFWILVRLADLYGSAGDLARSEAFSAAAKATGSEFGECAEFAEPVTQVFEAKTAMFADRDDLVLPLMRRALPRLRALQGNASSRRLRETLVAGLLVRSELAHGEGALHDALEIADEAVALLLHERSTDPVLALRARTMAALGHAFVWDDPKRAERELLVCYDQACAAGYGLEASVIAAHLSGTYRNAKRPVHARDTLMRMIQATGASEPSIPLGFVFIELAQVHAMLGQLDEAERCIVKARPCTRGSDGLGAVTKKIESQIDLACGRPNDALEKANDAQLTFARLRRTRFVGQTLVVQARAMAALGRRREATFALRSAIDILAAKGQPPALADARSALARI
ncbi:MAG TPA: hypothetical protein VGF18_07775 [Candidatus Tumulicola sp.]|jgi:tetratricopeptide (TPR) repeat protein